MSNSGRSVLPVVPVLEAPIALNGFPVAPDDQCAARLQRQHVPVAGHPRRPRRAEAKQLAQVVRPHRRLHLRGLQQGVGMVGERQAVAVPGIEHRPFPHAVTNQHQRVGVGVHDAADHRTLDVTWVTDTPPLVGAQGQLRCAYVPRAVQRRRQRGPVSDAAPGQGQLLSPGKRPSGAQHHTTYGDAGRVEYAAV